MTKENNETTVIKFRAPLDEKEKLDEKTDNMSRRLRKMLKAWNEVEEEYGLDEEYTNMDLMVLNTYKNAINKNISLLKSKRDKIQDEIDRIEDENSEDVLVEISIDLEGKRL